MCGSGPRCSQGRQGLFVSPCLLPGFFPQPSFPPPASIPHETKAAPVWTTMPRNVSTLSQSKPAQSCVSPRSAPTATFCDLSDRTTEKRSGKPIQKNCVNRLPCRWLSFGILPQADGRVQPLAQHNSTSWGKSVRPARLRSPVTASYTVIGRHPTPRCGSDRVESSNQGSASWPLASPTGLRLGGDPLTWTVFLWIEPEGKPFRRRHTDSVNPSAQGSAGRFAFRATVLKLLPDIEFRTVAAPRAGYPAASFQPGRVRLSRPSGYPAFGTRLRESISEVDPCTPPGIFRSPAQPPAAAGFHRPSH